jgi:hypothetical protein
MLQHVFLRMRDAQVPYMFGVAFDSTTVINWRIFVLCSRSARGWNIVVGGHRCHWPGRIDNDPSLALLDDPRNGTHEQPRMNMARNRGKPM